MNEPVLYGTYYDGGNSRGLTCSCRVDEDGYVHFDIDGAAVAPVALDSLTIPSRVGNTPRLIRLPGGACFETGNNDSLDEIIKRFRKSHSLLNPHYWESKLKYMVASVVLLAAMMFGFAYYVLPAASNMIARSLPGYVSVELASGVLDSLDDAYFEKSELSTEKKQQLQRLFQEHTPADQDFAFRLHFRKGDAVGANAFALPDGSVVLTDELVNLTNDNSEILAVLFHEMGHVVHRHSLRKYIEASGVAAAYAWLTGDLEGVSSMVLAVPVILAQAGYSRKHEWEADSYALEKMIENDMDPILFSRIVCKLHASDKNGEKQTADNSDACDEFGQPRDKTPPAPDTAEKETAGTDESKNLASDLLDYISTHPASQKRVERFAESSKTINANPGAH